MDKAVLRGMHHLRMLWFPAMAYLVDASASRPRRPIVPMSSQVLNDGLVHVRTGRRRCGCFSVLSLKGALADDEAEEKKVETR